MALKGGTWSGAGPWPDTDTPPLDGITSGAVLAPMVKSCLPDTEIVTGMSEPAFAAITLAASAERPPQPVSTDAPGNLPIQALCWSECENRFWGRFTPA